MSTPSASRVASLTNASSPSWIRFTTRLQTASSSSAQTRSPRCRSRCCANLQGVDIICLDHFSTLTTEAADVVIPAAVPGVESGGNVVRMDSDVIALAEPVKNGFPTQEAILKQLLEKVQP